MRIAIDVRPLMSGKTSGVEVYTEGMLHELFKRDSKNDHFVLWYSGASYVDFTKWTKYYSNVEIVHTKIPNKILNLAFSIFRWPKIDRLIGGQIDALWCPDPRPAPVSKRCKKVVTFHDLSFVDFKYSFNLKTRLWHKILRPKREASEADHITAVSKFTRQQILDEYGVDKERVSYIYGAASDDLRPLDLPRGFELLQRKYKLPKEYFLCLSTIEPRKNIQGIIKAFKHWKKKKDNQVKLVIAGKGHPQIFKKFHLDLHPDIQMIGFVDEEDKALLYQHAIAFLYPSFYEGFGLPIVEAMQCSAPVITSDASATKEVAGDAAYLVNPNEVDEIENAIHQLYMDETLRSRLILTGYERAEHFSWKNSAKELMRVFEEL